MPAERSAASAATANRSAFNRQAFWQTTKVYCDTCHFGPKARAKLNLEALDFAHLDVNGETWEKVLRKLRNREMPPAEAPRPEDWKESDPYRMSHMGGDLNRSAQLYPFETEVECDATTTEAVHLPGGGGLCRGDAEQRRVYDENQYQNGAEQQRTYDRNRDPRSR